MFHKHAVIAAAAMFASVSMSVSLAAARDSLKLGVTPSIGTAIAYVAKHEGIFEKHDLDVEIITGNGAVLIAGVVSNSMDVSLPTITSFLQAVDSGLPVSVIAGGNINEPAQSRVEVKIGTELKTPADFVGKTVGITTIGGTLQVLFGQWLIKGGVKPSQVNFVEMDFTRMADVLKQGTVDAVITVEPFGSRITSSGAGSAGPDFSSAVPDALPILLFVANNAWIAKNGPVIARFRAALEETVKIIEANPERARTGANAFIKMPEKIMASLSVPTFSVKADPAGIDQWLKMMKPMGLLKRDIVAADLVK